MRKSFIVAAGKAFLIGGVSAAAKEAEAGRAFLNFLTTPASLAVLKARGLEAVTP